jgi:outer membrane protein
MNYFSRLLLLLSLLPITSFAQQGNSWTLQECIEYAFKNNISIKQSEVSVLTGKNNLLQTQLNFLPTLSADGSYNFNFGNSIDPTTYQYLNKGTNSNSYSASLNLPLWTGLQQINNMNRAKNDLNAYREDYENMKNNTALSITSYFLQIVQNKELVEVQRRQLELSKQQLSRTMSLIESGSLPAGNRLQVDAQIASDELKLVSAENALEISKLSLKLLLQLQPEQAFELTVPDNLEPERIVESSTAAAVYSFAESNQPSIRSAMFRVKSADFSLKSSKGSFSPTLSFYGSLRSNYFSEAKSYNSLGTYSVVPVGVVKSSLEEVVTLQPDYKTVNTPYGTQLKNNLTEGVGFSLSVPIFQNYRRMTNVHNAKLNVVNAQLNLESSKNKLKQDVYTAYTNVVTAAKTYDANVKNVVSLRKTYEFAQERYNVGALAPIDLNTTKNNLAAAESELTKAKYDYIFKQKILEFYQGKTLTLQ